MITREEMIMWLSNPITKGLFEIFKGDRIAAEDAVFNSVIDNIKQNHVQSRPYSEVFNLARLETANYILEKTFYPLYKDLKDLETEKLNLEEERSDSIGNFINKINEVLKHEK